MTKQSRLYTLVQTILKDDAQARSNDKYLIWRVYQELGLVETSIIGMAYEKIGFGKFLKGPSFESITRARRKIQELDPTLAATLDVQEKRAERQASKGTFIFRETI